jgi:uncharacterized protein (UPF0218 family)
MFKGYTRDPQVTEELIQALATALRARPNERLGQLLINVSGETDLWNVYDETFLHHLRDAS